MRWLRRDRRRAAGDLRPSYAERQAALERVRERIRRRHGASARRLSRVRRATPLVAFAAFAAGVGLASPLVERGAARRPDLFAVRQVAVEGAERLEPAEIARAAGLAPGASWSDIAPEALAERLSAHPWIAEARAARVSPTTVVVRIVERHPAAVLIEPESQPALVDERGVPFDAPAEGFDALPRLVLRRHAERDRVEPRLAAGVVVARAVVAAGFERPELELELEGADPKAAPVLRVAGLAPRVVLGDGAPAEKLARLRRVLDEVPESRRAVEIDLRFEDQVVFRPAPPEAGPSDTAPHAAPTTGGRSG
jgi:cell division protein FtsQ